MNESQPPSAPSRTDRDIEEILNTRRRALADLMHSPAMAQGDMLQAVHQITETAAQILNVERASVWRLVDQGAVETGSWGKSGRGGAVTRTPNIAQ